MHVNDGTVSNRAMVYQNTTNKAISLMVSGGSTVATDYNGRATTRSKFYCIKQDRFILISLMGGRIK